MVIRTYIDKNNTIIKNSDVNTGRNPIAELYYGGKTGETDFTRHLLYFDINDLQNIGLVFIVLFCSGIIISGTSTFFAVRKFIYLNEGELYN